jgi:CO/xanthine dehydrogenase Mo-binding subunit
VDVERARALRGVRGVFTGADVPAHCWGPIVKEHRILAADKVRFAGEEVVAVVAVDEATALDALELCRVEYEELPAVFDPEEALRPGAPEIHAGTKNLAREIKIERGDVEAGFRAADHVFEDTYQTGHQYQAYMEPMGTVATVDASGRLTVWAPTQSIYFTRELVAQAIGIPASRVRVIQPYVGGGFGGKLTEDANTPLAAWLAWRCGRPVRLINTRLDDFQAARSRMPARIRLKMGVKKDGEIVAKEAEIFGDNGAYSGLATEIILVTAFRIDSLYRLQNVRTVARLAYTNKIPTGAFRGFGTPQAAFAMDCHLDALAERIGMDPVAIRIRNAIRQGETSVHGWYMGSCGLTECIERAADAIGWKAKRGARQGTGPLRRGVGIGCGLHVTANRQLADWDGSTVAIKLNEDGRVNLICGEGDIGQGAVTVLSQIAANELGVPLEHIIVTTPDTDTTPFCFGAFASRVTMLAGNAVMLAARAARAELVAIAAEKLEVAPEDLTIEDGVIHVVGAAHRKVTVGEACVAHLFRRNGEGIFTRATYDAPTVMADKQTFYGNVAPAYSFAAQAVEVEVDTETGQVRVLNVVAADDVGKALNPLAVDGQIHGAVAQGLGYALFEGLAMENGRLVNGNFADYTLPTADALPPVQTVLVETIDPNGPYGAKGASETPIVPTAGAVANAIYDAVGVRITSLPITPEKVLRALRAKAKPQANR